jgi:2-oxoisovalerate dehydrogenase E1 component beta subunit
MADKRYLDAIHDGLHEEMARDGRIVVLGEDVGRKGGVFGVTEGLYDAYGESRVVDTPLAESCIIGVALGMSVNGLIPVPEIQFADFIHPAFDQILSEVARLRYRSNNDYGCPMTIRVPYGGGVHGALYHSQSIEAFYAHIPGLKIVAPATPADAKGLLRAAIRDPDPVMYLEHKKLYRSVRGEVPEGDGNGVTPIGPAVVRRPGRDLSIFAYGLMLHEALAAAEALSKEGVEAEVVDLRTIKPLDAGTILESVERTNRALIVHEDNRFGGFGAEIAALIAEEGFRFLDAPPTRLGGPDVPGVPFSTPLENWFMIDAGKIAAAARNVVAY